MRRKATIAGCALAITVAMPALGSAPATAATSSIETVSAATTLACYYYVKRGDTARGIASKLGISYSTLVALNPGVDMNALYIRQRLRVPEASCDW
jgi:LysM repeat protein